MESSSLQFTYCMCPLLPRQLSMVVNSLSRPCRLLWYGCFEVRDSNPCDPTAWFLGGMRMMDEDDGWGWWKKIMDDDDGNDGNDENDENDGDGEEDEEDEGEPEEAWRNGGPWPLLNNDLDFRPSPCSTSEGHRALPTCCVASGSMELEMLCPLLMHQSPSFLESTNIPCIFICKKTYVYYIWIGIAYKSTHKEASWQWTRNHLITTIW